MRIRQIKPDFWADEIVASWPEGLRLFYIGLWGVADDAGYFEERPAQIAADLYRYQPRTTRERAVRDRLDRLVECSRVVRLGACGCARIPTMPDHQHLGGNRSFKARDEHQRHQSVAVRTIPDVPGHVSARVGIGKDRKGKGGVGGRRASVAEAPRGVTEFDRGMAAADVGGLVAELAAKKAIS